MGIKLESIAGKIKGIIGKIQVPVKSVPVTTTPKDIDIKKLTGTLDGLAANAKAGIVTKKITKMSPKEIDKIIKESEDTLEQFTKNEKLKELAKEGIEAGKHTAKEALNGAKALLSVTYSPTGKSASYSAEVFEEAGLTSTEKALDANIVAKKLASRKASLMEKYGERLPEFHAKKVKEASFKELDRLMKGQ